MAECQSEWEHFEFMIAAHNNFLDLGILEWCELFTESGGKHHWRQSISDQPAFQAEVLEAAGKTEAEFTDYKDWLRRYRNRFLAHLDEDNAYRLPPMAPAIASTKVLLRWLLEREDDCAAFPQDHVSAEAFHAHVLAHARAALRGEA
jgi:hypothetical protein